MFSPQEMGFMTDGLQGCRDETVKNQQGRWQCPAQVGQRKWKLLLSRL